MMLPEIHESKRSLISIETIALAVKKNTNVKVTSRFMNGKMLAFTKITPASFIYDVVDGFAFPDNAACGIYSQNKIIECLMYLLLTDTDSTSFQFFSSAS